MGERAALSALKGRRVLVTGATGFLGREVTRKLQAEGAVVFPVSRRLGFDLRDRAEAFRAFLLSKPEVVVHLAALVGGIGANLARPAEFFRDNMLMGLNVIEAAGQSQAKLTCIGTLCSYPLEAPLPISEPDFWNGYPEPTNAAYGISKKALFVFADAVRREYGLSFSYLVPCNLYGPGDNFDPSSSHVIPALIRKFAAARTAGLREVECWGTGRATRSFLYVEDAAEAIVLAAEGLDCHEPVNLAGGEEMSISDLAGLIAGVVGYQGSVFFDRTKPDGQPRRAISGERAKKLLGWEPKTPFEEGLRATVDWYWKACAAAEEVEAGKAGA